MDSNNSLIKLKEYVQLVEFKYTPRTGIISIPLTKWQRHIVLDSDYYSTDLFFMKPVWNFIGGIWICIGHFDDKTHDYKEIEQRVFKALLNRLRGNLLSLSNEYDKLYNSNIIETVNEEEGD